MKKSNYELIIIANANLTDEEAEEVFSKFKGIINNNGGELKLESAWGRRRLAYPINKVQHGIYRIMYFEGDGQVSDELRRQFAYDENTLKYFMVTVKDFEDSYNKFESLKEDPLRNVNLVSDVLGA